MNDREPSEEEIRQVMASMQNLIGKSFGYGFAVFLFLLAFALMGVYLVHQHVTEPGLPPRMGRAHIITQTVL